MGEGPDGTAQGTWQKDAGVCVELPSNPESPYT